jgi:hypothetical protein
VRLLRPQLRAPKSMSACRRIPKRLA